MLRRLCHGGAPFGCRASSVAACILERLPLVTPLPQQWETDYKARCFVFCPALPVA